MVNRTQRLQALAALLLLCTPTAAVFAADTAVTYAADGVIPDLRPRRVIVIVDPSGDATLPGEVLGESLVSALSRSVDGMLVRLVGLSGTQHRLGVEPSNAEQPELEAFALANGADAYIVLELTLGRQGIMTVVWRVGDALQAQLHSGEYRTPLLSARELQDRAWTPLLEAAREHIPPRDRAITLRLHGVPASRILIQPGIRFELDEDGTASLVLPVPGDYTIEARRAGYRHLSEQVTLNSATDLHLRQRPSPVAYAQVSLFNAQFPELAAGWLPGRRKFYLGGFATFFQYGLALRERGDLGEQSGISVSLPLTHLGLSAGYLFGTERHRTRAYLGLQPFLRLSAEGGTMLESSSAFATAFNLGLEYRVVENGAVFLEWTPIAYLVEGRVEPEDFYDGDPGAAVVSLNGVLLELTLIRVGYRHRF